MCRASPFGASSVRLFWRCALFHVASIQTIHTMAIQKRIFLIPAIPVLVIASVGVLAANATFRYEHPAYPDVKFTWGSTGGPRLDEEAKDGERPRAVIVGNNVHDFGKLDPLSQKKFSFTVRNDGNANLQLGDGGSTCKCTMANIKSPIVKPGEETEIEVDFNTGRDREYLQTAKVTTNDPLNKTLQFQVRGEVLTRLAVDPSSVSFGVIPPTKQLPLARTLVHSRVLDNLTLLKVDPSVELDWKIAAATKEQLAVHGAKSGFWIEMQPPSLGAFEPGFFTVVLNVTAEGEDEEGDLVQEQVRTGFGGRIMRRFTVYGDAIDGSGLITLGNVREGQGKRERLIVKIRDNNPELKDVSIQVKPDFVQTAWTEKEPGLYLMDLIVPDDAPPGDYSGSFQGEVVVKLKHDTVRDQVFPLEFDVLPKTFR